MERLPIDDDVPRILDALRESGAAVIVAEPGAGKTTRVPPAVLRSGIAGEKKILMLEPRRVAARAAARRIAAEMGQPIGETVGFQVRFERTGGARTRLWVVTEGILARRLQDDPFLEDTSVVILDEFHERSLDADMALALLVELRRTVRPDLKIIVMSATIDPGPVATFLGGAPIIDTPGRTFPVEVSYLDRPDTRPLPEIVARAVERVVGRTRGDVLVFLPGAGEIARTADLLDQFARVAAIDLLPLHGELSAEAQDRAIEPGPMKKVILSTNVAETSLTIEGVTDVIDSGFVKRIRHDPRLGLDRLEQKRISRASAVQRAGRAGRTGPGRCLRLWTLAEDHSLEDFDVPEVRRVDLARPVLELAAWGEPDPAKFRWFEAPKPEDLDRARALLQDLGAIDPVNGLPTRAGRAMLSLPVHPRLARFLVEAHHRGVARDAAVLCGLISEKDIILGQRAFGGDRRAREVGPSDLLHRLDLYREAERGGFRSGIVSQIGLDARALRAVQRVAGQLERAVSSSLGRSEEAAEPEIELEKSLLAGYPDRVARRRAPNAAKARMVGGRGLAISERSVVKEEEFFIAVMTEGGGGRHADSEVRWASRIDPRWLDEIIPGSIRRERHGRFDEAAKKIVGYEETLYRDLVIAERQGLEVDREQAREALAQAVRADPESALPDDEDFRAFVVRWRLIVEHCPELEFPTLTTMDLAEAAAALADGRRSIEEIRRGPIIDVLLGRLTYRQKETLEREAPERIGLPGGRTVKIRYEANRPPVLAARVQHLFGMHDTPRICRGRVGCVVELLAPNMRPVQITQDLRSFWMTTYQQVRKDLRGRYPKHDWPERAPGFEDS